MASLDKNDNVKLAMCPHKVQWGLQTYTMATQDQLRQYVTPPYDNWFASMSLS